VYAIKTARIEDVRREFAELHRRALVTPGGARDRSLDYFEVPNATFIADRSLILPTKDGPDPEHAVAWDRDRRNNGFGRLLFGKVHGFRFQAAAAMLSARTGDVVPIDLSDSSRIHLTGVSRLVFSLRPSARGKGLALGLSVFADQLDAGGPLFPFLRAWHLYVQETMLARLRRTFPELSTDHVMFHVASLRVYSVDFEALATMARTIFSDARPNAARVAVGDR
jgi:hypothetical protein